MPTLFATAIPITVATMPRATVTSIDFVSMHARYQAGYFPLVGALRLLPSMANRTSRSTLASNSAMSQPVILACWRSRTRLSTPRPQSGQRIGAFRRRWPALVTPSTPRRRRSASGCLDFCKRTNAAAAAARLCKTCAAAAAGTDLLQCQSIGSCSRCQLARRRQT